MIRDEAGFKNSIEETVDIMLPILNMVCSDEEKKVLLSGALFKLLKDKGG